MRADSERVRSEDSVSSPESRRQAHEASVDAPARGAHTFQSSALELVSVDLEPQLSATTLRRASVQLPVETKLYVVVGPS